MKKIITILIICLIVSMLIIPASASNKSVTRGVNHYSYVGIKIFRTSVTGYYTSSGGTITAHGTVVSQPETFIGWSCTNPSAWWINGVPSVTHAECYGQAKFVLGFASEQFSIGLQSCYRGNNAVGDP